MEPRGLRREQAAAYLGISPSKLDDLVRSGRMPKGKRIDGCVIWDRNSLDEAFDVISAEPEQNEWDEVLSND